MFWNCSSQQQKRSQYQLCNWHLVFFVTDMRWVLLQRWFQVAKKTCYFKQRILKLYGIMEPVIKGFSFPVVRTSILFWHYSDHLVVTWFVEVWREPEVILSHIQQMTPKVMTIFVRSLACFNNASASGFGIQIPRDSSLGWFHSDPTWPSSLKLSASITPTSPSFLFNIC